jgi:hypothetical protein
MEDGMRVSIELKDTIDNCTLELNNTDLDDEILLAIIPHGDEDAKLLVQINVEELRHAVRKLTCK